jgi:serine/threonine protein kinase/Tol biopolymer transport system component
MIGKRLGPYEVLAKLGEGGMGEVYKARDTRLDRIVAVKVIIGQAAARPEFRERFEREARAISALDHPHICTLHDVGHDRVTDAGGTAHDVDFLVMQFLEGETLADRLARSSRPTSDPSVTSTKPPSGDASAIVTMSSISTSSRGPLAIDGALRYAREIALALDAAHRRGIVHRDLKPGNVMITKTGTKLLDFGLAKLATPPVAGFEDDHTRAAPLTGQGAILGTLHYMSPEQLENRDVDSRSDIFAFGAVLYEMVAGRRPFDSPSHAGVIAEILGGDPPTLGELADTKTRLPIVARRALDRLLQKCLAKDPDDRWQSAADLADELAWINEERLRAAEAEAPTPVSAAAPVSVAPPSRTRERMWMAATLLALLAAGVTIWLYPPPPPDPSPVSFTMTPPDGTLLASGPGFVEVSPDGQQIAFVTSSDGSNVGSLWIRSLGSMIATRIPSGETAWHPVWSPNGKSIAFTGSVAGGVAGLKRIDLSGGPALTLATLASERPAWGSQGIVLFTGEDGRLYKVADTGGAATAVTALDTARQELQHAWPEFLPDGRRFVYLARSSDRSKSALYLASLDSPSRSHIANAISMVEHVPGYLVYQSEGTIMALPFDDANGHPTGEPMPLVENVQYNETNGRAAFSLSETGLLAYRSGGTAMGQTAQFTWFDRTGKRLGTTGKPARYVDAALSPDGRRLVASERSQTGGALDLVMMDVERDVTTRFTSNEGDERSPVWTADSQSVIFQANEKGPSDLSIKAAGGATAERVLFGSLATETPVHISKDGATLLYEVGNGPSARLWSLALAGEGKPFQVFPDATDAQRSGKFSPDGKWIAYVSGPPRRANVYVQPFPPTGVREQVSTTTGNDPHWTAEGRQIVFVTSEGGLMSVDVTMAGGQVHAGRPQALFSQNISGASQFEMDAKGERFLLLIDPRPEGAVAPPPEPLTVVVNWLATLKKR